VSHLPELIREYAGLLDEERRLNERKEAIRAMIQEAMAIDRLDQARTEFGTAQRMKRFKLIPKRELVLETLDRQDLFPFANFTSAKVTEILVPKFGRERLLPLFDVEKTEYLLVKRQPR
jgi:hypothetical protein